MTVADLIASKPVLIFDLDGTLVDTAPAHAEAFSEVLEELGITDFDYDRFAGRSTEDVFREILSDRQHASGPGELRDFVRRKQERAVELIEQSPGLLPGAGRFLQRMRQVGKRMALATSASRNGTAASLRANDIGGYFETVVTGEDVSAAKPSPEIYLKTVREMNCPASDCLVFEDSSAGCRAALAAHLETVVVVPADRTQPPGWAPPGVTVANFTRLLQCG